MATAQPMIPPVMYTYQNGMAFFNMPINGNTSANPLSAGPQNSTSTESLTPSVYGTVNYTKSTIYVRFLIYFIAIIVFSSIWKPKCC